MLSVYKNGLKIKLFKEKIQQLSQHCEKDQSAIFVNIHYNVLIIKQIKYLNWVDNVIHEGKSYELVAIDKPDGLPYIMLEILGKESNSTRGIHIITPCIRNYAQLGRGHEADVRIADISVSRWHAVIKFENQKFILEDTNSKFGTLILSKNPVPIRIGEKGFGVQIGKTVLFLSTHKRWKVCESFICGGASDAGEVKESVSVLRTQLENKKTKQINIQTRIQEEDPIIIQNPQQNIIENEQILDDLSNNSEEELIEEEKLNDEPQQNQNNDNQQNHNNENNQQNLQQSIGAQSTFIMQQQSQIQSNQQNLQQSIGVQSTFIMQSQFQIQPNQQQYEYNHQV